MSTYRQVCERWRDICLGWEKERGNLRNPLLYGRGGRIFSHRLEIGRLLREQGRPRTFLLNGDKASNAAATRHQGILRDALANAPVASVIIPFQALDAAGIDKNSIELVHALEDRIETHHHHLDHRPPGSVSWVEPVMVRKSASEIAVLLAAKNAKLLDEWTRSVERAEDGANPGADFWARWALEHPNPPKPLTEADLSRYGAAPTWKGVGQRELLHTSGLPSSPEITVTDHRDGTFSYEWQTSRHWLGESLIRARVESVVVTLCRTCKGTGRDPKYPDAEPHGDHWYCPGGCNYNGTIRRRQRRWAYFLSGFDHQEPRPLYFFCELPSGAKPTTVEDAYQALKPEAVLLAEQMGRTVTRQGDIFAIAMPGQDERALITAGATFVKRGVLLGTNHKATEVAYLATGQTLARGVLYHHPDFRRPDHIRRRMTKGWNLVVKNTVPITEGQLR